MSLKLKFLSGITLAVAVGAFSVTGFAQDSADTAKKDGAAKTERAKRGEHGKKGKFGRGGQFGKRGFGKGGFAHRGGEFRGIELTDAQKEQIKTLRQSFRADRSVMSELREISKARRAGTVTEAQKVRAQEIRAQQKQQAELLKMQIDAVLTAEQKAQIEQNKEQRKVRMQERMQKMQERRQQRQTRSAEKPADNQ